MLNINGKVSLSIKLWAGKINVCIPFKNLLNLKICFILSSPIFTSNSVPSIYLNFSSK